MAPHVTDPKPPETSDKDKLVARPEEEPLPTAEDPEHPRTEPVDPKTVPERGESQASKTDKIDYTA